MVNYDGRVEIEWNWSTTISSRALPHRHTYDVNCNPLLLEPGMPVEDVTLIPHGGGGMTMQEHLNDYATFFDDLLGTEASNPVATLWLYPPEPSQVRQFITAGTPDTPPSYTGACVAAHARIYTLRTSNGGRMNLYWMEDKNSLETQVPWGDATGADDAYFDYILGSTSPHVGRDGGIPIAGINVNFGQNEKLRRKRYRTT